MNSTEYVFRNLLIALQMLNIQNGCETGKNL